MDKKKRILWLSPYAPYDSVAHGGGKTHNFYIKYFKKSNKYDITLLSLCMNTEKEHLDLNQYGIDNHIYVMDQSNISKICRILTSGVAYRNPFDKYGATCLPFERYQMKHLLKFYKAKGIYPDFIILQWTFALMLIDDINDVFPKSKIIVIEEDVTFLNYVRRREAAKTCWSSFFWRKRYQIIKRIELNNLKKADLVVTNNSKDTKLLVENGIDDNMIFTSAPYFENYSAVKRTKKSYDVLFFGAMYRAENYLSAIWFIEKVMPLIEDSKVRFVILGGNPDAKLKKYENNRIVITGFVNDVSEYFERCICMAAPLVGGAGIKIKVLEAMSAGVPVLTNEIGIEGIGATDKKEYFYCETPKEFAGCINKIVSGSLDTSSLSNNCKSFISKNYDLSTKLDQLMTVMDNL